MADFARVTDPKTGCRLKLKKAIRLYEQGVIDWIVEHVSYRRLTLAEMVERRSEIARRQEPIPFAEIPGLIYQPAPNNLASTRHTKALSSASSLLFGAKLHMLNNPDALKILDNAANQFCAEHAS